MKHFYFPLHILCTSLVSVFAYYSHKDHVVHTSITEFPVREAEHDVYTNRSKLSAKNFNESEIKARASYWNRILILLELQHG